jgi:hypothetical protein
MLKGAAHLHFLEGDGKEGCAALKFEETVLFLEKQGVEKLVATFHLRHPSNLQMATPQLLLKLINEYDGNIHISLMPEANMVLGKDTETSQHVISHDIDTWRKLDIDHAAFEALLDGWIVSAHFTSKLGWSKKYDHEFAVEQTYDFMSKAYNKVMCQNWKGWIGHPYQWCRATNKDESIRQLLETAIKTSRIIEISTKPVLRKVNITYDIVRRDIPLFKPELIAQFASYSIETKRPLISICLDAHQPDDLEPGLENASKISEWLINEGVDPMQIWE